jgi:hypothetical protein
VLLPGSGSRVDLSVLLFAQRQALEHVRQDHVEHHANHLGLDTHEPVGCLRSVLWRASSMAASFSNATGNLETTWRKLR